MIDIAKNKKFHPLIRLPEKYEVYDFTSGYDENRLLSMPFGIGKYNEKRKDMYKGPLYEGDRNIHMGIDIGAPAGTPVYAFYDGEIFLFDYNAQPLDYGYTIITQHIIDGTKLFVLHGHLSKRSIEGKKIGQKLSRGEIFAWIGEKSENGGWNPHIHIQLSLETPTKCDLPGVVSEKDLTESLKKYPDPRIILGPLYK